MAEIMAVRIYADFNDQDEQGRVLLHAGASLTDLRKHARVLRPGLPVILYTDANDYVEVAAILRRDESHGIWVAEWSDQVDPGEASFGKPSDSRALV
jgi:hypothetical protein